MAPGSDPSPPACDTARASKLPCDPAIGGLDERKLDSQQGVQRSHSSSEPSGGAEVYRRTPTHRQI